MSKIAIGKAGGKTIFLDLNLLLRTRALVQGNSGSGKTHTLQVLAEQLFGKVQLIIIDPEGEFSILRKGFDFLMVGKGGDTPADCRSAAVLAHKLLELRASAICDLYEMKASERHRWVRLFLEALVDSPKHLWHPVVVIIDEFHLFAPEKGAGESEAAEAVISLATRGRKRGLCLVGATQRIGKLRKDVAAELLNVLVGMTFMDIDRKRAAETLGIPKEELRDFFAQVKTMDEGNFFALGRAISKERLLVKINDVRIRQPKAGAQRATEPPPPTAQVKALLPKLGDLPKEADTKAKTEAELKAEVRRLTMELAQAKKGPVAVMAARRVGSPAPAPTKTIRVEVPIVKPADVVRLERAIVKMLEAAKLTGGAAEGLRVRLAAIDKGVKPALTPTPLRPPIRDPKPFTPTPPPVVRDYGGHRPGLPSREAIDRAKALDTAGDEPTLDKAERAILAVLAQNPDGCNSGKLTLLAGYRWSGGFRNSLGALRSKGFISGQNTGVMKITEAGQQMIQAIGYLPLPIGRELVDYWMKHPSFGACERKILEALYSSEPDGLTSQSLVEETGYQWSGGFRNALGALRTAGVIVGKNNERMRLCDELLEAAAAG